MMGGCSALGCNSDTRKGAKMHRFPSNIERKKTWLINMRRDFWEPGSGAVLCSKHFEEFQYELKRADGRKILKNSAVPTLFDVPNPPQTLRNKQIKGVLVPNACTVPASHCCAPGKDDQLFKKWIVMIQRNDKILSSQDKICELPFEKECIETDYITKMPDGSLHKIPIRYSLMEGSVPTIFPNLSSYPSAQANKRKAPIPHPVFPQEKLKIINSEESAVLDISQPSNDFSKSSVEVKNISIPNPLKEGSVLTIFPNLPSYPSAQTNKRKASIPRLILPKEKLSQLDSEESADLDIPQQSNDFSKLSIDVKNISVPNSRWSVACIEDHIIFAKWNSKFCSERRVVICKDLSIKIFLMKVEVSLSIEVTVENISQLLQRVDDFKMCENADSETSSGCFGFTESKSRVLCIACFKSKKKDDAQRT